jgi:hypothetical protein
MRNVTLDDNLRKAIDNLMKAQPLIVSAMNEYEAQGYFVVAANLKSLLDDLILRTDQAKAAII